MRAFQRLWHIALACVVGLLAASGAVAGGGPENVFLLINANSTDSKTIANNYIALRRIPPTNVLYIDWQAGLESTSGKAFVERILKPALAAIEERRLTPQIDYLVYSSDFPWRINLRPMFPEHQFEAPFNPLGSLTGLTYLAPFMVGASPSVVMPSTNWYVPAPNSDNLGRCQRLGAMPSRGFRARYLWDARGNRTTDTSAGQRYLLSTMLGVTQGRGNSVQEVLSYLRRAVEADGTRPRGTVYFMRNGDVRSKTRHDCYDEAAALVQRAGVPTQVVQGTIPRGANNVIGIMAGTANFDWRAAQSTILPGAICEHLTSSGGDLRAVASQTPLSEFLRAGAAGASGTVVEPRAVQAKFPLPSLQVHYVRGCSLAESFYQSVSGPYQLLIVGDPLCQPWARFPTVTVDGVEPGQEVSGELSITPAAVGGSRVGSFELFVDGRLVARSRPGATMTLDSTKLSDGYHELRVVGISANAIETQGRAIVPLVVNNHAATVEFDAIYIPVTDTGPVVRFKAAQPGATAIVVRHNGREVARLDAGEGQGDIPAALLGSGPVTLQAASEGEQPVASLPVEIRVP